MSTRSVLDPPTLVPTNARAIRAAALARLR
jgi:hypothetical protein